MWALQEGSGYISLVLEGFNLNKKFLKFHINLVEGFMVDLKTFLSLAICHKVNIKLILG